jgi:hypothetical protein
MCLFFVLLAAGPRAAIVVWWLADPIRWNATFSSVIWPILGVLFAPWTTLTYALVVPGGVNGFDYVWIGMAVLVDIASYSAGGVYSRRRSGATA